MRTRKLLTVEVVTDDETGIYVVGEMDYGVPSTTEEWLEAGDNRQKLASWLRHLAQCCSRSNPPFGDKPLPGILRGESQPEATNG